MSRFAELGKSSLKGTVKKRPFSALFDEWSVQMSVQICMFPDSIAGFIPGECTNLQIADAKIF